MESRQRQARAEVSGQQSTSGGSSAALNKRVNDSQLGSGRLGWGVVPPRDRVGKRISGGGQLGGGCAAEMELADGGGEWTA